MDLLIGLSYKYIIWFNQFLFSVFPFTKDMDQSERFFFCAILLIGLQAFAVIFSEIAEKL